MRSDGATPDRGRGRSPVAVRRSIPREFAVSEKWFLPVSIFDIAVRQLPEPAVTPGIITSKGDRSCA
jgi:hypothetical protein